MCLAYLLLFIIVLILDVCFMISKPTPKVIGVKEADSYDKKGDMEV